MLSYSSSNSHGRRVQGPHRSGTSHKALALALLLSVGLVVVDQSAAQGFDPKPEDYAEFAADIQDLSTPLLSCDTVGVFEALTCQALCEAIDGGAVDLDETRDVNTDFTCACESQVACSDIPTCGQLTMKPGSVEESCALVCDGRFTAAIDEVEFAGAITAANKDMTHFVMECRCDGDVECSDYIQFSDIGEPITCSSIGVNSAATCDTYCEEEGGGLFDLKGNFTIIDDGEQANCECLATSVNALRDVDIAPACTDTPTPEAPEACTLQEGCGTKAPGGGNSGGGSGAMALNMVTSFVALTLFVMAGLL